jgi:preprotein translocase subunit SecD
MNRYPLWKYVLIGVALVIGIVYTLPNFFPEVPAVQVSTSKSDLKIDTSTLQSVEAALKAANISYNGETVDATGVKVRFADPDTQLKAKDVLQSALNPDPNNPNYIVALNLLSSSPSWLAMIGARPMYLGLDLRGGVHFLLQVDMQAAADKAADRSVTDIRSLLREKRVLYAGIARQGQSVAVHFRDPSERAKAIEQIGNALPDLQLKEVDAGGESDLVASLKPEAQKRIADGAVQQNITILRNRVNELGVAEPIVQQQGSGRVVVQLPGVQDTARAKDILGRTAGLEFRMVEGQMTNPGGLNYEPAQIQAALAGNVPPGTELVFDNSHGGREPLLVSKNVLLTGERLSDASPGFDQNQRSAVMINVDPAGGRIIRDASREAIKRRMAILMIERGKKEVLTAPVIQDELGSRFQITGNFTPTESQNLSLLLKAGALAAPMEIIEERTVGPSLGKENIDKGFHSVLYGFAVLAVFICAYYELMGIISVVSLAVNLLLLIAILSMLQATLTLPGIAAVALTLGMAIDANVLINERIREELRWGDTPHAAIQAGYERAWNTILDSNVTTGIAGLALLIFGSGPVRGFAVVHCLGILTSMFSAVFVSRGLVAIVYGGRKKLERISIGQVWKPAT